MTNNHTSFSAPIITINVAQFHHWPSYSRRLPGYHEYWAIDRYNTITFESVKVDDNMDLFIIGS